MSSFCCNFSLLRSRALNRQPDGSSERVADEVCLSFYIVTVGVRFEFCWWTRLCAFWEFLVVVAGRSFRVQRNIATDLILLGGYVKILPGGAWVATFIPLFSPAGTWCQCRVTVGCSREPVENRFAFQRLVPVRDSHHYITQYIYMHAVVGLSSQLHLRLYVSTTVASCFARHRWHPNTASDVWNI